MCFKCVSIIFNSAQDDIRPKSKNLVLLSHIMPNNGLLQTPNVALRTFNQQYFNVKLVRASFEFPIKVPVQTFHLELKNDW